MADDRLTRTLKAIAVVMVVGFVGWAVYDKFFGSVAPGDMAYHAGNQAFEDGLYERAAEEYHAALAENPEHRYALQGLARSLHLAGRYDEALMRYDAGGRGRTRGARRRLCQSRHPARHHWAARGGARRLHSGPRGR
jgi:hypothetical protein